MRRALATLTILLSAVPLAACGDSDSGPWLPSPDLRPVPSPSVPAWASASA